MRLHTTINFKDSEEGIEFISFRQCININIQQTGIVISSIAGKYTGLHWISLYSLKQHFFCRKEKLDSITWNKFQVLNLFASILIKIPRNLIHWKIPRSKIFKENPYWCVNNFFYYNTKSIRLGIFIVIIFPQFKA